MAIQQQPSVQDALSKRLFSDGNLAQLLVTSGPDLICLLDLDGRFVYASPAFKHILGYAPAMLVGTLAVELAHPDDQGFEYTRWNALAVGESVAAIYRHRHADGTWRWLDTRGTIALWNGVKHVLRVAHDVSAQREAEQRREAAQRTFAALVHNSADLIATADLAGQMQFINAAGQRLLETTSLEEAKRTMIADYFSPDQQTKMFEDVLPTVLRDGVWEGDLTILSRRTQQLIPVKTTIFTLVDHTTSQPTGFASVSRDVRPHKQVEQRLRLLAAASAALGSSLYYEQALAEVARLVAQHLDAWCVIELGASKQTPYFYAAEHCEPTQQGEFRQRLREQSIAAGTFMQRLEIGDQVVLLEAAAAVAAGGPVDTTALIAAPLLLHEQHLGALVIGRCSGAGFGHDDLQLAAELANRAALSIEHARLYREAQTAIGVRDQFMSIASHELKTPLTSVLGNLQLLQRRLSHQETVTDRDQRALRVVIEQAQRMNQLISTLLDISRIQTGQLSIESRPLDIVALARRVVEETQPTFDQHTIYFHSTVDSALIVGDAIRLEQVLHNLLQNAVKYSPNSGRVEMLVRCADARVELVVRDQGIGIPKEALPHLFERFYRAANVEAQHLSGIGIGLFVVREVVTLHGGDVSVASGGEGTIFTVRLPLQEASTHS